MNAKSPPLVDLTRNQPQPATTAAATAVPPAVSPTTSATPTTPAVEDDRDNDGESLSTFSVYQPSALPQNAIRAFNSSSTTATSSSSGNSQNEVIDLEENDTTTPPNEKLHIPSHTSLACESNLLSSVPAPLIREAEVVVVAASQKKKMDHYHEQESTITACVLPLITGTHLHKPCLSPLQMEGVLLAIQRHQRIFTNSQERAGFFLGDGAGIGKGRQIAAILRDSLCRTSEHHTKRHLWLSVSRELIQDARRDLQAVGVHCDVQDGMTVLNDHNKNALGKKEKGIMFLTYPFLVSGTRLEQIVTWCAGTHLYSKASAKTNPEMAQKIVQLEESFSGCIIFDEAHKAKNIANNTKTAQLVLQLQRRLPKARVVYCSATGVSDVAHLAYAERLGLWDNTTTSGSSLSSTHNFKDFAAFEGSLSTRGLGSLELLALELKQQGSFMARTLSWDGAEFENAQVSLTKAQQQVYNRSVQWWNQCKTTLELALKQHLSDMKQGMLWRIFWSAHQRFFKELAICAKIAFLAKDALKMVHVHGRCVVIGLQSTGESGMQSLLESGTSFQDQQFPHLLSTLKATLITFVKNHFPIKPDPPEVPKLPSEQPPPPTAGQTERENYAFVTAQIARILAMPAPQPIEELVQMRQTLLDDIETLDLPPNPLDDLIDRLGGEEQVAEMTGRSGRMLRACGSSGQKKDYFIFSKRVTAGSGAAAACQDDSDRLNLVERRAFQDGKKSFAIISDAASTGISLHAARGSGGSHKRRVHYTIELPWSADKAVQQLGRSHRSGQESAPVYKLVVTTLGGETRFAAAVSKRMASLGALTKGDRRAATGGSMLADFDLDSKYGKRALKRFYQALENNERFMENPNGYITQSSTFPSRNTKELLNQFVQDLKDDKDPLVATLPESEMVRFCVLLSVATAELELVGIEADNRKKADVRVFLNRLAGLPVTRQSFTFSLFMSTLDDVIKDAKATGEFEGTAEDINAEEIKITQELDLAIDPASGAQTKLTTLALDRGISFQAVCKMAMEDAPKKKASSAEDTAKPKEDESVDGDSDDELIVGDEEDEWMSKSGSKKDYIAPQGFYVSRNKIAGRHLYLYAKHKFDRASFETSTAAAEFDPMGWMCIARPNTGTGSEMSTQDLKRKYHLLFSCELLGELMALSNDGKTQKVKSTPVAIVEEQCKEVADRWKEAYKESNHYKHHNGLAPRRIEVALVTGPVLHVLPALENAVRLRSERDKALKIMRAQVNDRRIVGVRFPTDEDAIQKLQAQLAVLVNARTQSGNAFIDEALAPVCVKSQEWATTERKTMKSFFAVQNKSSTRTPSSTTTAQQGKGKTATTGPFSTVSNTSTKRSATTTSAKSSSSKKTKSIASFFAPVKKS